MTAIADTSAINYLVLTEQVNLLRELYGRVIIPQAVFEELQKERAPRRVREWIVNHPDWLEVQQLSVEPDATLQKLGPGERAAIALAEELRATVLILDERDGRREASRRNLPVTGVLGIFKDAAERGLIDLPTVIHRLRQTSFRASPELLQYFLDQDIERSNIGRTLG